MNMVKIYGLEDAFYYPPANWKDLEVLVRFPDGEYKRETIPNSTIWQFNAVNHAFRPEIHAADIGCGITAFIIPEIDFRVGADIVYHHLRSKRNLGRGNHFVDICSAIDFVYEPERAEPYHLLLLHTHGKGNKIPQTVGQAIQQQDAVSEERIEIGFDLLKALGTKGGIFGNWPHNTVEETEGKVIYRKGVVKVEPEKLYILPAHLGAKILVYSVNEDKMPPYSSMPHATGRAGPRNAMKVSPEEAAKLRDSVYIPPGISNESLRSEHPSCYNDFNKIFRKLLTPECPYFRPLGETQILSYVGKI